MYLQGNEIRYSSSEVSQLLRVHMKFRFLDIVAQHTRSIVIIGIDPVCNFFSICATVLPGVPPGNLLARHQPSKRLADVSASPLFCYCILFFYVSSFLKFNFFIFFLYFGIVNIGYTRLQSTLYLLFRASKSSPSAMISIG